MPDKTVGPNSSHIVHSNTANQNKATTMDSQEALEIVRAVSPARLKAAMALESDPSKDWSEIPAADRDIITAASWDDTCRKIAAEKAAEIAVA